MPIDRSKYVKHPVVSMPKPPVAVQEEEDDLSDVIRNPERSNEPPKQKPYEPNHVRLGIEPYEPRGVAPKEHEELRSEVPPQASVDDDMFFSVDGDVGVDPSALQGHHIDNNEFVNFDASPLSTSKRFQAASSAVDMSKRAQAAQSPVSYDPFENDGFDPGQDQENGDDEFGAEETFASPEMGELVLMIFGQIVDVGSHEKIEERVKAIIYGEDIEFRDQAPEPSDLIILRRVPVKIGVFIEK